MMILKNLLFSSSEGRRNMTNGHLLRLRPSTWAYLPSRFSMPNPEAGIRVLCCTRTIQCNTSSLMLGRTDASGPHVGPTNWKTVEHPARLGYGGYCAVRRIRKANTQNTTAQQSAPPLSGEHWREATGDRRETRCEITCRRLDC